MSLYRGDDDRLLDNLDADRPYTKHTRSHAGQQMAGCTCDDCRETRERLQRALTQAVAERAERELAELRRQKKAV